MNPYSGLPPEQRMTQRLVDQFKAGEQLWQQLAPYRKARRKRCPRLSRKKLKTLDRLEFANAKPPQDCVGRWIDPQTAARAFPP